MRWEPQDSANDDLNDESDDEASDVEPSDGFEFDEFYDFDPESADDDGGKEVVLSSARPAISDVNDFQELVISNGNIIGHRDYKLIYRQRAGQTTSMATKRRHILATKLIGNVETTKTAVELVKRGQRVERLRQRQTMKFQFRAHKLAEFFKQQIPM